MDFWNREEELSKIRRAIGTGQFGYITGRRRVGKTALRRRAADLGGGIYHQAVEGTPQQQLIHLAEEIGGLLPIFRDVVPKNWSEFFRLLSREKLPRLLIFDEFPYWTEAASGLPSVLQKWVDHELPKSKTLLLIAGSSQAMLYSQFLNRAAPLYGRASLHVHLELMSYRWFCRALHYAINDPISFERYSLVGGVPHYWKLMPKGSLVEQAEALYFQPTAILAEEPIQLLRDERVGGTVPKALLDLVGRGVTKPSELASRLGMAQANLSRPLAMLLELGLLHRDLPFGESTRTTKKVFYSIQDPALAFYYGTYLPFRSRWTALTRKEKETALHHQASRCWENFCRQIHPGSSRYWEPNAEFDMVFYDKKQRRHVVAECKWGDFTPAHEKQLLAELEHKFQKTQLHRKLQQVAFRLFTDRSLPELAALK